MVSVWGLSKCTKKDFRAISELYITYQGLAFILREQNRKSIFHLSQERSLGMPGRGSRMCKGPGAGRSCEFKKLDTDQKRAWHQVKMWGELKPHEASS